MRPHKAESAASLGQSIASIAEGQVGVTENPQNTNCNPYTGYWGDGTATGLGGATCRAGYRANAWCADFAAWVWRQAGVSFTYGSVGSDINAWSASFYEWGRANNTWHPLSSSYSPQPGDVAVYGNLTEAAGPGHVAIVTGGTEAKPNVVNGNWAMNAAWTEWGVVAENGETSDGESGGGLQGYVSPIGSSATAPAAPTSVSATPSDDGYATVSWQPGSDGGSAISSYTVTSNPAAVSLTYMSNYTSVVLDGLTTGVSYTFTVTATNGVGTSAPSAPSNAIVPYTYPDPPTLTSVTAGDGQATVNFSPPANDGYTPITYYQVTAGYTDPFTGVSGQQTATGSGSPITVTGLVNGEDYWFYVQAFNAGGYSASSSPDLWAIPLPTANPMANVYVTEPSTGQVVEVSAASGSQTVIASGLSDPQGVAVDPQGDVFVASSGANKVVEIPAGGGSWQTIGSGFSDPTGLALDANGDLFVADTGNNRVIELPAGYSAQHTIGSGFSAPEGVAVDAQGNVLVADTGNDRVVEVADEGSGAQTTLVSTGSNGPVNIAVNPGDWVTVTDPSDSLDAQFYEPAATQTGMTWGTDPDDPGSYAYDLGGYGYIAELADSRVVMQSASGPGEVTIASGLGDVGGIAENSAPPAPQNVDVTPGTSAVTVSFQPPPTTSGYSPVTSYQATCSDVTNTVSPAVTADGTASPITVSGLADGDEYSCVAIAVNAIGPGAPGTPTAYDGALVTPTAAEPPASNLFVADYYGNAVDEVPASTGVSAVTLASGLDGPEYVAVDSQGDVYVADVTGGEVLRFPAGGGNPATVVSDAAGLFGVALDSAGNLYVGSCPPGGGSSSNPCWVTEYPANGGASRTVATDGDAPQAFTVDAAGDVFISDTGNVIEQPAGGGQVKTLATGVLADGLAVDSKGDVYYALPLDNEVVKIAAGTGVTSTVGTGLDLPEGVAVDSAGNVYIADTFNNRVIEVPASGGPQVTVESGVSMPAGIAVQTPAVPGVPANVSVSASNEADTATLVWSAPASAGASAITGYAVAKTGVSGPLGNPVIVPATTRSYTFQDVPTGTPVTFSVQAVNLDGSGGGASTSTTLVPLPAQTITFSAPSTGTVGGSATLSAVGGGSGNPVVFSLDPASTAGACQLSGDKVSYTGAGSCVVDANQAGNSSYLQAPQVQQIIVVTPGSQQISVSAPEAGTFGGNAVLSATGGASGNPVVFSVDDSSWPGTCSVSGTDGTTVSYTGVGTCVIDANQAGSASYAAATQVQRSITVGPASQRITFTAPGTGTVGSAVTLSATGGASGNPVVFTVAAATKGSICSVSGTNGTTLHYTGAGKCLVDANQAGNASPSGPPTYSAAPQVQASVTVGKAPTKTSLTLSSARVKYGHEQSEKLTVAVTFAGTGAKPAGSVTVKAGSVTVCVIRLSAGRGSCTLTASKLKAGTYHLVASYAGSADYDTSVSAGKTLRVSG